jgi:hypothetical protein
MTSSNGSQLTIKTAAYLSDVQQRVVSASVWMRSCCDQYKQQRLQRRTAVCTHMSEI